MFSNCTFYTLGTTLKQRVFTKKFLSVGSWTFGIVPIVLYGSVTTYFWGLVFVQLLFLMLYLSGLWGPLLRSMYIKRNKLLKFQFLLGSLKKLLGKSISYYQAREKGFWADSKAWKLMSNALPLPNWVKMAKFDDFLTKIAEFFFTVFGKLAPQTFCS